jgi:WD40 repeat protein
MDVTANGWIFTGHASGTVTIWDATTGEKESMVANPPHSIDVLSVSEDGRWLACGPRRGGVAYLLDIRRRLPHRDAIPVRTEAIDDSPRELTLSF